MRSTVLMLLVVASPLTACGQVDGRSTVEPRQAEVERSGTALSGLSLPPGFEVSVYARVPGARSLALTPGGTLFVGTRGDRVYAVRDEDGDLRGERVVTVDDGLRSPNGVAFKDGALYVAEISRILRYDAIESHLDDPPEPVVVSDAYPTDGHHGWKYIAFGPDGLLYVPVGAPCNVCDPDDEIYATITRLDVDGGTPEIFASGVRNTVGFGWRPDTGVLWFTDNGRDWLGDDRPPDELNRASEPGLHFGFPYCHGGDISDPEYGQVAPCSEFAPPAQKLGPHVAALGLEFYTGEMFPATYRGQIFIAEHGSWNRSEKIGYRITLVRLEGSAVVSYEPFATGWLTEDGDVWGRPVDLEQMADGSLLVSDDRGGAVYRISYRAP